MQVFVCDLCKKQIAETNWATISFPRIIDGEKIIEFYKESDICHKCMISLTKHTKVTMIERQPAEVRSEIENDSKPAE